MISKQSVMVTVTAQDEQTFAQFSRMIDERLKTYDGTYAVSIAVPKDCSNRVVQQIKAAYSTPDMGWKVKCDSGDEQHDGSWDNLVFS